ncbi:DNA polymerase I [Alkalibacter saccharofermentans]|uniref:DNA polymerase I n=1 Tax=Alkalibacter saccharofermentans DSM 14828 TaxID=1120975 RepID=A0A1M4X8H0_9FIRM|nr:DNA polymerase I [Alkalibacter saccharofermentans]SHE89721.1 DNA polymerase I [Alkalibacter saccharofermentans DSM 14828]
MEPKKMIIIDGYSLIYRTFYGVRPMATKDGIPTNVIFGFANILINILENYNPDYIGVAFDEKKPTFRHDSYENYKAGRMLMPEDLEKQIDLVMEMLVLMDIKKISLPGYEADDLIGTISKSCSKSGIEVDILTGDRDSFQLIDPNIKVLYTKKGISEVEIYDEGKIMDQYGVSPRDLIDVKGLMGDKSDNIPGVAGIGEKTAIKLIKEYGDIEGVYANIHEIKGKMQEKLLNDKENAFLSRHLAEIVTHVPLEFNIGEYETLNYKSKEVVDFFERLECFSIVAKIAGSDSPNQENEKINTNKITEVTDNKLLQEAITVMKKAREIYIAYVAERDYESFLKAIAVSVEGNCYYISSNIFGEDQIAQNIKEVFESENIKKIGHDFKRLYSWALKQGINLQGVEFDAYLAAYLIDPSDNRYKMNDLASKYLNKEIISDEELYGKGKSKKTFDSLEREIAMTTMCTHADLMEDLRRLLAPQIEEYAMASLYKDIELPLTEVLAFFEHEGFRIDLEELDRLDVEFDEKLGNLKKEIYSLSGQEFNINSPKQLGEVLFEKLMLPVVKKTKTGYSTDAEVLEKLKGKHPVITHILDYRTVSKLSSTYVKGFKQIINFKTEKIHSTFNQALTTTGRISSSDPNLQNIPVKIEIGKKIRKVFIPSKKDQVLIDADYSQIELRILAHISGDETLISSFINEEDIHTRTASEIFGVEIEDVTSTQRVYAKAINFGLIYGKQAYGLSQDLGISRKEAQDYIDRYFGRYPKVEDYMKNIVKEAKDKGFVTTLFGRRRYLPEIHSRNAMIAKSGERLALNTPIQGSAADIIKIAMIDVYRELKTKKSDAKLILTVHDELVIDCPLEEVDEVKAIVKDKMEGAASLKVPMTVEISQGENWYQAK